MPESRFDPPVSILLAVAGLVAMGLWLRLWGIAWDGWASLHPDERHMVFVTNDVIAGFRQGREAGLSLLDLLFGADSPIDPRANGRMMVYGDFPVLVIAALSGLTGATDWGGVLWTGRVVTSMIDASTVLAVFLLGHRLSGSSGAALIAALLYALAPTPLQLAVFYTVDPWLVAASTWALLAMVRLGFGPGRGREDVSAAEVTAALAAGALLGLATACKVSGAALSLMAVPVVILLGRRRGIGAAVRALALGLISALVVFRLAHPFAFAGPGLFGLAISPRFLESFRALVAFTYNPDAPPSWQWMAGYPVWALLRDLAGFGIGPAVCLAAVGSLFLLVRRRRLYDDAGLAGFLLVTGGMFVAIGLASEVKALRYFAPAFPIACLLVTPALSHGPLALRIAVIALAAWWGAGVMRLHDGQHPRLIASEWMRHLPAGTRIGFETAWDETLPVHRFLPQASGARNPDPFPQFEQVPLDLTAPESPDAAARIAAALDRVDYLVVSSGRQIEVMPRLPERFRTVTRHYRALASGELCFTRVLHLDRGFPLPGLRLDDRMAQEPWRVFDHPVVSIWRKTDCFSRALAERLLSGG